MADTAQNLITAAQAAGYAGLSHRQKLQCLLAGVQSGGEVPFDPDISELIGYITYGNLVGLPANTTITFNQTTSLMGYYLEDAGADLVGLAYPNLVSVTGTAGLATFLCSTNPSLASFSAPLLQTCTPAIQISVCPSLPSVSFPSLVTAENGIFIFNNSALVSVSIPLLLPTNGTQLIFSGCALNQASVDLILARAVANAGYISGTITLTGGTNSTPSAAGLTDKATLVGRGVTVTNN